MIDRMVRGALLRLVALKRAGSEVGVLCCDWSRRKWAWSVEVVLCCDWSRRKGAGPGRHVRGSVVGVLKCKPLCYCRYSCLQ